MNKRKEIKIESSLEEMYRVEQFVEEISDEYLLYNNYFGNLMMAITEAVKNAIVHGNKSEKRKRVMIGAESTREGLWIRVQDEGAGFDITRYSHPENFEEDLEQGKSGMMLIHRLADEVKLKHKGRVIDMLFRINGIDESIMQRRAALMQDFFRVFQRLNT
jgi:serine/threonine-protein kinase RsbW